MRWAVTDHAVVCACERVLDVDMRPHKRAIRLRGDEVTAAALLAELSGDIDVEAVRAALSSVARLLAVTGATALRRDGYRYIGRSGVLITVTRCRG